MAVSGFMSEYQWQNVAWADSTGSVGKTQGKLGWNMPPDSLNKVGGGAMESFFLEDWACF